MVKTFYVLIAVEVQGDFTSESDLLEEFENECDYNFPSSEKVKVLNQEWLETSIREENFRSVTILSIP